MAITPNGKTRHQVNQGGMQNETIWDSSFFNGVSGNLTKEALAPISSPEDLGKKLNTDPMDVSESPESQAMSQSNSARLNPDRFTSDRFPKDDRGMDLTENESPEANFDPITGEPLNGVDGTKLLVMLKKWLASNKETSGLNIVGFKQQGTAYTVTVAPQGKAVVKG